MKKRGRPIKSSSRRRDFKIRFNSDEFEMLNFLAWKTGSNKAEVVRKALKMYFEIVKHQY